MSDRAIRFAAKFNPGDLDRDVINKCKAAKEGDKTEYMLGTVIGKIRGVSFRNNPNDPTQASIGFLGVFEGIPADDAKPIIQAPMAFLPKSVHDLLVETVTEGLDRPASMPQRGKPQNHRINYEIPIKFEIGVRRHSSPIGFEFITNALIKRPEAEDTLAELRGPGVVSSSKPALAAPKKKKK